jgi:hypothetical protein
MTEEVAFGQYSEAYKAIWQKLAVLAKALESIGEDALLVKQLDIDVLLRTLLNTPLARLSVDSAGRLRIVIDVAGIATPVTISSGTVTTVSTLSAITTFPYGQSWELMQRANIEYDQIQRSKMVIT